MKITVETNSGVFDFECGATDNLLYAGLTRGLTLPYECATGTCGTCRGRIMQGSAHIDWDQAPGFAKLKRDKGDVLLWQGRDAAPYRNTEPPILTRCANSRAMWSISSLLCRAR